MKNLNFTKIKKAVNTEMISFIMYSYDVISDLKKQSSKTFKNTLFFRLMLKETSSPLLYSSKKT